MGYFSFKHYIYLSSERCSNIELIIDKCSNIEHNLQMKINQEQFQILRKVSKKPSSSQRELANELDISLGKINFILNELKKKGLIKINNFKKNRNKVGYLYVLTPKGIAEKTKLTINFMKIKMREYDELKNEIGDSKETKEDFDNSISKKNVNMDL